MGEYIFKSTNYQKQQFQISLLFAKPLCTDQKGFSMKTTETEGYKCTVLKGRNSLFGYCKIQITITKKKVIPQNHQINNSMSLSGRKRH